ncbi:MAG: hypothetical protein WD069_01970 [Planctomycetales bacterium]
MKRSPLVSLVILGVLIGAAIGISSEMQSFGEKAPRHARLVMQEPQEWVQVASYVTEQRTRAVWRIEAALDPDDGTTKYSMKETTESYFVSRPVVNTVGGDDSYGNTQSIWFDVIDSYLHRHRVIEVFSLIEDIADDEGRALALSHVLSWLKGQYPPVGGAMAPPAPYSPVSHEGRSVPSGPINELLSRVQGDDAKREMRDQAALRDFVAQRRTHIEHVLKLADSLSPSPMKAGILLAVSDLQYSVSFDAEAEATQSRGADVLKAHAERMRSWWALAKSAGATVLRWAGGVGLAALFFGLFLRVVEFYCVDALATRIGSERFAKALGTTLRTTVKESGLILPEHFEKGR